VAEQAKQNINVILKADVQGTLQALTQQLDGLTHEEVVVRVIHSAIGAVTESDVSLAIPSTALVLALADVFRLGQELRHLAGRDSRTAGHPPFQELPAASAEAALELGDEIQHFGPQHGSRVRGDRVGHLDVRVLCHTVHQSRVVA
jgi:hypothetical protein